MSIIEKRIHMKKYECDRCGYIYDPLKGDPENGIAAGTAFEDLPQDWECPDCTAPKEEFSQLEEA
jgi:rubredoxin